MKPTPQQWRVIEETERHLLVSAGAGTGKTSTVISHILYLVGLEIHGKRVKTPIRLQDIAAITFTNAAAADLKKKLRAGLREMGQREESYLVDTLRIGTIHAFCGALMREFALRAGGHPYPEVLDEGEAGALAADAAREAVLEVLDDKSVADLDALFHERSVELVEADMVMLMAESDRLHHIALNLEQMDERERATVALAQKARTILNRRLDERGLVDFDQMIVRTRDLLRDDSVRRAAQRRMKVLIIDEFQDVDPVQREIAYLLGQPGNGSAKGTRLVIVGDPKQSIYRFRRADVTVWNQVRGDFDRWDDCDVVPISENFRSTDGILGFVDATVGKILSTPIIGDETSEYEVPFESLSVGSEEQQQDRSVELLLLPAKSDGKDYGADELRAIEAAKVAERAAELVESGEFGWGDIAVLLTGWGALDTYQGALESLGAPTYAFLNEGFYTRREVLDMILALEVVRDPTDDLTFFGFLRSPFVGAKDETLLAVSRQVGRPYWFKRSDVKVRDQELWERGCDIIERYAALRDRMPTDVLLASLLEETGYLAHLRLMGPERDQALANVQKFLHMARGMAQVGVGDLLRTIEEARARDDREPDALLSGQENAVTLTSIHSAKGLEWKVVFFCDTIRGPANKFPDLLVGRDTMALKPIDPSASPNRHEELKKLMAVEEAAERKRLWYVAMTRARRRLIVSGLPEGKRVAKNPKTPAEFLWSHLQQVEFTDGGAFEYESHDGTRFVGTVRLGDPSCLTSTRERDTPTDVLSTDVLPPVLTRLPVAAGRLRHSATEFLALDRCERRHWFKYGLGVREPSVNWKKPELLDAIARGLIVHDVLERLREETELDALLEDAIGRHDEDAPPKGGPVGTRYRDHLREEIALVADHPEYRAVADLPAAKRELDFLAIGGPLERYEGSFDLAAWEGQGYVMLDVKTPQCDEVAAKRKARHYAPQRDVYVSAAESIGGADVERFAFQFSRAATQVSEEITPDTRKEIRGRVAGAIERIEAGKGEMTAFPTECRFCGYKRIGWCPGVEQVAETGELPSQMSLL